MPFFARNILVCVTQTITSSHGWSWRTSHYHCGTSSFGAGHAFTRVWVSRENGVSANTWRGGGRPMPVTCYASIRVRLGSNSKWTTWLIKFLQVVLWLSLFCNRSFKLRSVSELLQCYHIVSTQLVLRLCVCALLDLLLWTVPIALSLAYFPNMLLIFHLFLLKMG